MGVNNKGFTLVEVLIVLGIIAIMLPASFTLFLASMRAQLKVSVLQEVKRNGDTALNVMDGLIKTRATSLEQQDGTRICETAGSSFSTGDVYFVDEASNRFRFYDNVEKIASESSVAGSTDLTNTKVAVTGFSITCERESVFTPPLITIAFTVSQAADTTRSEESARLDYQTRIRLRTY